jgi:hypothetical protein
MSGGAPGRDPLALVVRLRASSVGLLVGDQAHDRPLAQLSPAEHRLPPDRRSLAYGSDYRTGYGL